MKLNVLALVLGATAFSAFAANAQTVIEERHDPAIVIEQDRPAASVTVKEHGVLGEKKVIKKETTGAGVDCSSKTVHKEGLGESKTVTKTNCD
jgi:hypothetical protein